MATIKDVAQLAGVSASTVSATLNGTAPVKEATRKRVMDAIEQSGYRPNSAARSLRSGSSKFIGMIVPDISNPHFATSARAVERVCTKAGYMVMVYSSDKDPATERKVIQKMAMQRIAGLIHIPTLSSPSYGEWFKSQVDFPVVLLDSYINNLAYDSVVLDHHSASMMATDYLLRLGHRDIAVFMGTRDVSSISDRLQGCLSAMEKRGVKVAPERLIDAEFEHDRAYAQIQNVMMEPNPPTAVIGLNNTMTIGILRGLKNIGLKYPQDVSVVGIDDFELSDYVEPPITLVSQPIEEMACKATKALLNELETGEAPSGARHVLKPSMSIRGSCRPL